MSDFVTEKDTAQLEHLTWPEAREAAQRDAVVLIPVGATEQHGHHLPLGTDTLNVAFIAKRAARATGAVMVPALALGVSQNHRAFPGTLSLTPRTLISVLTEVVDSLYANGFRRFIFVNGHGGNNATIDVAAIELRAKHPTIVVGNTYAAALTSPLAYDISESGIVYHAEETETCNSLYTTPALVDMSKAVDGRAEAFTDYYHKYYHGTEGNPINVLVQYGLPQTETLTATGVMGDARPSTAEKGQQLAEFAIDNLIRVISDAQDYQFGETLVQP